MKTDLGILHLKKISNDLEACAYDLRNNLDAYGSYDGYLDPSQKEAVLQKVNETVDWIYDDQKQATLQDYEERMKYFQDILGPLKERQRYHSEVDSVIQQFEQAQKSFQQNAGKVANAQRANLETRMKNLQ